MRSDLIVAGRRRLGRRHRFRSIASDTAGLAIYASRIVAAGAGAEVSERHGFQKRRRGEGFRFCGDEFPMFEWMRREAVDGGDHPLPRRMKRYGKLESGVEALNDPLSPLARCGRWRISGAEWTELGRIDSYSSAGCAEQNFRALGMTEERRGALWIFLEALEYARLHGGIALGLDRIVMILPGRRVCGGDSVPEDARAWI